MHSSRVRATVSKTVDMGSSPFAPARYFAVLGKAEAQDALPLRALVLLGMAQKKKRAPSHAQQSRSGRAILRQSLRERARPAVAERARGYSSKVERRSSKSAV